MSEHYKFFDSTNDDIREYTASEFAGYFAKVLTNGVYTDPDTGTMGLKVTMDRLRATVSKGYAYIEGYAYENDSELSFDLSKSDNVLDRIDRIVLKLDITNRKINLILKEGRMGSQPKPPELVNLGSVIEIPIAQIKVSKNADSGIVIDERQPISSLVKIPFEDMKGDFEDWFQTVKDNISAGEVQGGQFPQIVKANNNISNESQIRNIILSEKEADSSGMQNGDIWIKYE